MFALVESGSITKYFSGNKGVTINDVQHPKSIFTLWTEAERNAIGVYTVEIDATNKKDELYYINTDITYTFSGGKAKGAYGTATAKALTDTLYTAQDETDGYGTEGDIKVMGLKSQFISNVKAKAANELGKTDWYITRKTEKDTAIPSAVTTHRDAVRTKQAEMETAITNAADVAALETLYTSVDGNPRPIGYIPTKEF